MPDGNPVADAAAARAERSSLEGFGLAKDAYDLCAKVSSGDWTAGLVSAGSLAFEVRDLLADPLAKLVSLGLGWVIELFGPLRWVLDQLTGDQQQLNLVVETWSGVAAEMTKSADDLHDHYTRDSASWSGPAVTQYRLFCANQVELYRAGAAAAQSVSVNARMSGLLLTMVREIVRGLITDAVGKAVSILCRNPPPVTPAAVPEITQTITATGNKIVQWLRKLKAAFENAQRLLRRSVGIFRAVKTTVGMAGTYGDRAFSTGMLTALGEEIGILAKGALKQAVKEIPGELGQTVGLESGKAAAGAATPPGPPEPVDQDKL
ncbi:hypothetical protein [Actinophytocola oryzae]|uniref:PPE family protein n=1 Tax=Actinophytocola oryzae TaxID=502181 RepID=A0A4R7VFF3_9PSEU|nr:hypothetical protein [Actinophytocola oryzae]TDV47837.1 hypothetical protein CLV71_10972 [Actinophytocola oryzae]